MDGSGGWPSYTEKVSAAPVWQESRCRVHPRPNLCGTCYQSVNSPPHPPHQQVNREPGGAPAGIYGLPSSSLDVPPRGRQLQRESALHQPPCGSWQAGGGPGAYAGGHTRSLSAPPVELTEHWAVGHTGHPPLEPSGPQHEAWCPQHTARPGPSTHTASQVLPLLAEAPAQPSPSSLLPAEQQAWLKQRLAQAQQQLARQRAEQAAWAAAAAQLLRGRAPQPPHHHPPSVCDEARCPTCGGSGQDSTEATDSQQLEELIDSLEADLEQQLGQLQRRQRWEQKAQQAQQAQHGPHLHAQPAGAAWERRQERSFPQQHEDLAWERQRQEQSLLRMDQEQWQRAAAAAMQQQPLGAHMPSGQRLGQPRQPTGSAAGYSYDAGDDCNLVAPVRLSAPARLEQRQQVRRSSAQPWLDVCGALGKCSLRCRMG